MMSAAAYRAAEVLERVLPRRWVMSVAVLLARLAFAARVPARRALEGNLATLARRPRAVRLAARRAFEQFARGFVEFLALERMSRDRLQAAVEVCGIEHVEAARAARRGVILLSAHFGNWEWGAAALGARGLVLHLAARPHDSRTVEAMFERRRRAFGLARLTGGPLWPRAARLLRERGCLAVMADRSIPGARHPVCVWAAALARRTGAVLLPAITVRTSEGRYALLVEPAMSPERCAQGGFEEFLHRQLTRHPDQWCAFEAAAGALV